jgi:hypothetical protein
MGDTAFTQQRNAAYLADCGCNAVDGAHAASHMWRRHLSNIPAQKRQHADKQAGTL